MEFVADVSGDGQNLVQFTLLNGKYDICKIVDVLIGECRIFLGVYFLCWIFFKQGVYD